MKLYLVRQCKGKGSTNHRGAKQLDEHQQLTTIRWTTMWAPKKVNEHDEHMQQHDQHWQQHDEL